MAFHHLQTTEETAARLGVHPVTLARDRANGCLGGIPCVRMGRTVRYCAEDVDAWLDERQYIGGNALPAPAVSAKPRKGGR